MHPPVPASSRRPLGRVVAAATAIAAGSALLAASPAQAQAPTSRPGSVASVASVAATLPAGLAATLPTTLPTGATATSVAATVATGLQAAAARRWLAPWSGTLRRGDSGPQVRAAQLRLIALGYWLDGVDGEFGSQTTQAVLALQKVAGIERTGKIDRATTVVLTRGTRPQARTRAGSLFEVDIQRQVIFIVSRGRTAWAINTSTGSGRYYVSQGVRSLARTPRGRFAINRQIDGERVAPLGVLFRPKYFYGGYAIHGSSSIPAYAASHGCVRVSDAAINWLWSSGIAPIGRRVWIY